MDHLRAEIQATGFPLEIEISSILDKDWLVYNNDPFVDLDEGKSREIDIYAIHESSFYEEEETLKRTDIFPITSAMVVECKKSSSHAWVFFTRPQPIDWEYGPPNGHTVDFLQALTGGKQSFLSQVPLPRIHYDKVRRIAYNFVEAKLSKQVRGEDRAIFEAVNQLWKCLTYNAGRYRQGFSRNRGMPLLVQFPVIVLDGQLYEAVGPTERIRLLRRKHVVLSLTRRSKNLDEDLEFVIDVVTKPFFRDFTQLIKRDIGTLHRHFQDKRLVTKADSLVENLS